jgi:hypothetical protein
MNAVRRPYLSVWTWGGVDAKPCITGLGALDSSEFLPQPPLLTPNTPKLEREGDPRIAVQHGLKLTPEVVIALVALRPPGQRDLVRAQRLGNDVRNAFLPRCLSAAVDAGRHDPSGKSKFKIRQIETRDAAGIPPHALAHCHSTQNENQRGCLRV